MNSEITANANAFPDLRKPLLNIVLSYEAIKSWSKSEDGSNNIVTEFHNAPPWRNYIKTEAYKIYDNTYTTHTHTKKDEMHEW